MSSLKKQLNLYLMVLVGLIVVSAVVAFSIASRLQRLVSGPILKLAETARFISVEGKFSLRAEQASEVEINSLVNAFNRMLDAIQEREEKFSQSEEQFRAAFEVAAVGNVMVSLTGNFLRVNSEFCKMIGYTNEELLKMKFSDITHPEDLKKSIEVHDKIFQNDVDSFNFEKRYITKDGKCLWAIVSVAPIHKMNNKVSMLITVIQDITERKRAEEERDRLLILEREARVEAEKSVQMRDEFLSIASHELRTPITPIKIHFSLVKRLVAGLPPNSIPQQDYLIKASNIAERQAENLEKLIEDLLSVSRITAGRLILNCKICDLSQLVRDILERFQVEAVRAGCKVIFSADESVVVFIDPLRIEQVFMNIFNNALKYGVGKPIEVSVSKFNNKALIKIKDNGMGIAEKNLGKIFDKFERVGSIKNFPGLGLGLYISKGYVEAHHGEIQVESKEGQGTMFTIFLPLKENLT